ncbi:MAG: hypothetical protein ACRD0U_00695 [Acidimicrobiales bacterium]
MTTDGAGVAAGRAPNIFAAVVGYTLRACVPPKRRLGLALPCVGAVLFGLLATVVPDQTAAKAFAEVASLGLFGLVIPLGCLIIGDAVLGAEIRAGTFHYTWLSPVPFPVIAAGRWLGGWIVALVSLVPASALAALVAGVGDGLGPVVLATAASAAAYVAVFVVVGAAVRRAAVWSLVIVFLVERLLGTALSGIAQLSPMWLGRAVYAGLGPEGEVLHRDGVPEGWAGVVRLALITLVAIAIAAWRLRRLRLAGSAD